MEKQKIVGRDKDREMSTHQTETGEKERETDRDCGSGGEERIGRCRWVYYFEFERVKPRCTTLAGLCR